MQAEIPDMQALTVPGVGHTPTLGEPAALQAVQDLVERAA
jgi:hypothetical protein